MVCTQLAGTLVLAYMDMDRCLHKRRQDAGGLLHSAVDTGYAIMTNNVPFALLTYVTCGADAIGNRAYCRQMLIGVNASARHEGILLNCMMNALQMNVLLPAIKADSRNPGAYGRFLSAPCTKLGCNV